MLQYVCTVYMHDHVYMCVFGCVCVRAFGCVHLGVCMCMCVFCACACACACACVCVVCVLCVCCVCVCVCVCSLDPDVLEATPSAKHGRPNICRQIEPVCEYDAICYVR